MKAFTNVTATLPDGNGGTTTILSDDNGNETDDGTFLYTWDFQNRLRTVTRKSDGALIATYSYDAMGRRIRKVVTNSGALDGTTDYDYDGWHEIEEHNGTDGLVRQYVFGATADEALVLNWNLDGDGTATGAGDQRLFYHQNTLGSVFALTDGRGDNGSPTVSPSGRHIAFTTTRWGKEQIAIIDRSGDVSAIRQITNTGNNSYPSWQPIRP